MFTKGHYAFRTKTAIMILVPSWGNSSFEALKEVLNRLDSQDREIILLGDTNCDLKTSKNALIQKK